MSWRVVVVASNAKLDYKLGYLVVRTVEEVKRVHLSEIGVLMLENTAISLTAYLMCELIQRKVKVIFCDHERNPYETLDCGAHLHVLRDYFSLSLDDRKLQNQFQKVLQFTIREELPEATDHLQQEIVRYLGLIAVKMDYPLSFTEGEYILPLLKAVKCQPVLDGEGALEQLMQYMELYSGLMSQQCFALVNAHQYFSREELTELYQMANYQKWHLILLEQIQMPALSCEDIYLVDQNLCEIRVDSE